MSIHMTSRSMPGRSEGATRETTEHLPVPEGAYKKAGKGLLDKGL